MLRSVALSLLALAPVAASAADNGVYAGVGITHSDYGLDNPLGLSPFDDRDTGYKLFAGWRPLDHFGLEASYADHGRVTVASGIVCIAMVGVPCPTESRLDARGMSLFAVGYLPVAAVDLFAKVGVNRWQVDGGIPALPGLNFDESGSDLAWGAGAQLRFGSLAARAEYERFKVLADEDIGMISLSVSWTFF